MNFVKLALDNGGSIHPLILPHEELQGPSLTNPSVYNDNGKIIVNLRNINYTLYHAEKNKYENHWGPLVYIHPENDMHLRTWNYLCEMDENMRIKSYSKIDTTDFPDQELWEFVGLEDCRIVRWDNNLYVSGVRRDLDTKGTGRMEICEIQFVNNEVKQISQFRIPTPVDKDSYCEKNWMPITDMPFHYVKWTNGTEVVRVNPETKTCEQVCLKNWKDFGCGDLRGGSQVIPVGEYRMCLTHETYENYNFINLDVQGYEMEVLKGAEKTLENIDYLYCEVNRNEVYEGNAYIEEIDNYLSNYNMRRVETFWWYDGPWGDALYIK
jgi:hypothetical protein